MQEHGVEVPADTRRVMVEVTLAGEPIAIANAETVEVFWRKEPSDAKVLQAIITQYRSLCSVLVAA